MFEQSLQLVVTSLASVLYWFERFMSSFPLFISLFASFFVMHRATEMLVMKLGMQRSEAVRRDLMIKQQNKTAHWPTNKYTGFTPNSQPQTQRKPYRDIYGDTYDGK